MSKVFLFFTLIFSTVGVASNDELELIQHIQEVDSVNVLVDPRLELLSVIQLLNEYFLITKYDQQYKQDAIKYFKEYQAHEAVKYFKALSDKGFKFSYPAESVLYLKHDFSVNNALQIPSRIIPKGLSKKDILRFYALLKQFAIDSNFIKFYKSQKGYYNNLVATTASMIIGISDVERLESFYGKSNESYNIVLVSLFHHGGFGPEVSSPKGKELFSLIGPSSSSDNVAYFGDEERLTELINHEFSHSFIKQTFTVNADRIKEYEHLYSPIAEDMEKQGYPNWEICLNEHIVRAVTVFISFQKNTRLGNQNLSFQKGRKYIYIDYILEHFEKYQEKRNQFPTFESYFPEILKGFDEVSRK